MSTSTQPAAPRSPVQGRRRLAIAVAVIAVVWLGLLPWIGGQPELAARIRREQALGIDPSAMFYTELEIMPEIIRRFERLPSLGGPSALGPVSSSSGEPCSSPGSRRIPAR